MTHEHLVRSLMKPGGDIINQLTALDAELLHMAVGISGESGEFLDTIKKAVIYRKEIDLANCVEELGDLEFFMEGARQLLGITREQTLKHNIDKLTKRYGEKYSNEAAQRRLDKAGEE